MLLKGFKTKLNPNNEQRTLLLNMLGALGTHTIGGLSVCFKTIALRELAKEKGEPLPKFPSAIDLHKKLNAEVKPEHEWFYNSSKCGATFAGEASPAKLASPQQALRDLENAWKRHLKVKGSGTPKRKKKFANDHFYLDGAIAIKDGFIRLPRIGWLFWSHGDK